MTIDILYVYVLYLLGYFCTKDVEKHLLVAENPDTFQFCTFAKRTKMSETKTQKDGFSFGNQ